MRQVYIDQIKMAIIHGEVEDVRILCFMFRNFLRREVCV